MNYHIGGVLPKFLRDVLLLIVIAGFSAYYIDVGAYNKIGIAITWGLVFAVIILSIKYYSKALMLTIFICSIIPATSRKLFELYGSNESWAEAFQTIYTVQYSSITLIAWLFVWLGTISILTLILTNSSISYRSIKYFLFQIAGLLILIVGISHQENVFLRRALADFEYPVMVSVGLMAGCKLVKEIGKLDAERIIIKIIWFGFLICGIRAYFFVIINFLNNISRLSLGIEQTIFIPFVFMVFVNKTFLDTSFKKILFYFLFWLVIMPIGRSLLFLLMVSTFILLVLYSFSVTSPYIILRKYLFKRMLYAIGIVLLVSQVIFIFNPRLENFIRYKFAFFEKLISSGMRSVENIRLFELKNIVAEINENGPGKLFFGKGAGGTFNFEHYESPVRLGIGAFSKKEIAEGTFLKPHSFVSYWLLKGGIIGLVWYTGGILYIFLVALKRTIRSRLVVNEFESFMIFFCPVVCWVGWWKPVIAFLFGCFSGVLLSSNNMTSKKGERNTFAVTRFTMFGQK